MTRRLRRVRWLVTKEEIMDIQTLTTFFMWCTIINGGIFILWTVFSAFAPDFIYRTQSKWFPILVTFQTLTISLKRRSADGPLAVSCSYSPLVGAELLKLNVSATTFHWPSSCFLHTVVYLPFLVTGLPSASSTVSSRVPME